MKPYYLKVDPEAGQSAPAEKRARKLRIKATYSRSDEPSPIDSIGGRGSIIRGQASPDRPKIDNAGRTLYKEFLSCSHLHN